MRRVHDAAGLFGADADIKLIGDWDGNGTHTPGIVRLVNGAVTWSLRNSWSNGPADVVFNMGLYGDIPVVGDWDNNGTWTAGVVRGSQWFLRNANSSNPTPTDYAFWYGVGGDTKLPGKWVTTSAPQPMTAGVVRLDPNNGVGFYQTFSNPPGAGRAFQYGLYTDRPIAGDWITTNNSTHFGPGMVRDESAQQCGGFSHNQGWYLKYNNSAGGGDVFFKFELNRP